MLREYFVAMKTWFVLHIYTLLSYSSFRPFRFCLIQYRKEGYIIPSASDLFFFLKLWNRCRLSYDCGFATFHRTLAGSKTEEPVINFVRRETPEKNSIHFLHFKNLGDEVYKLYQ